MPKSLPLIDVTAPVCCAPMASGPLTAAAAVEVAVRLKALADPTRLRVLSLLLRSPGTEACTCELAPAVGVTRWRRSCRCPQSQGPAFQHLEVRHPGMRPPDHLEANPAPGVTLSPTCTATLQGTGPTGPNPLHRPVNG